MTETPKIEGHLRINFNRPTYPDNTQPKGFLSDDVRAQACWHFYTLAEKQRETVGDSIDDQFGLLEGNLWMDRHYIQTARTVAMIHGLESPDEFAKAWNEVRLEAARCKLPKPHDSYTRLTPRFTLQ
jgi:hypothetical protein